MSRALGLSGVALIAAALGGCGEESRISISADLPPPLSADLLTVTVQDGEHVMRWSGPDFQPRSNNATPTTPEAEIATSGPDLELTFLLEYQGDLISSGSITLARRSDWRWGISIWAATENPELSCFGCEGSQAFGLPATFQVPERDSIWVVWGGNSISDPVIY
jgi:hypothetical protein